MTDTTQRLVAQLEAELERLPEEEQEERVASYLKDVRQRKREPQVSAGQEHKPLYEPFQLLLDADLDLPPDYSQTYEEHLYGTAGDE